MSGIDVGRRFPSGAFEKLAGHHKERGGVINLGMAVAALLALFAVGAHAQRVVVSVPTVEGPITGPGDIQLGIRPEAMARCRAT